MLVATRAGTMKYKDRVLVYFTVWSTAIDGPEGTDTLPGQRVATRPSFRVVTSQDSSGHVSGCSIS